VENAEFLRGEIEKIPLPDASVDVIVSNCVVNLSTDKDRVFAEAFRVLRPGGRLAISDIVAKGEVPAELRRDAELWAGCLAGALEESEFRAKLAAAGFDQVEFRTTRVLEETGGRLSSAFVRAVKPATGSRPAAS
jgi:SAM-dependent methyltransferase